MKNKFFAVAIISLVLASATTVQATAHFETPFDHGSLTMHLSSGGDDPEPTPPPPPKRLTWEEIKAMYQ